MPRTKTAPVGRVEEERKRQILAAAAETVAEMGVERLTFRAVAQAAGVSIGMITYYFPTKNDLLIGTLRESVARMTDLTGRASRSQPSIESVRTALEISLRPTEEGANWPFRLAYAAHAAHDEELRAYHVERLALIRGNMLMGIRGSMEHGELDPSLDAELLADAVLALYQGLSIDATLDPARMSPQRAMDALDLVLGALRPAKAGQRARSA